MAGQAVAAAPAFLVASGNAAYANAAKHATLDGESRVEGIRQWIEIAEPSNLGLLFMGIAGLFIGRWAAAKKRKGPPEQ